MKDSLKARYQANRYSLSRSYHKDKKLAESLLKEVDFGSAVKFGLAAATDEEKKAADEAFKDLGKLGDVAQKSGAKLLSNAVQAASQDVKKYVGGSLSASLSRGAAKLQSKMNKGLTTGEENPLLKGAKFANIMKNGFAGLEERIKQIKEFNLQGKKSVLQHFGFEPRLEGGSIADIVKEAGTDSNKKKNADEIKSIVDDVNIEFKSNKGGFFQNVVVRALTGIPYLKDGGEEEFLISLLSIPGDDLLSLIKTAKSSSYDFDALMPKKKKGVMAKGQKISNAVDLISAIYRHKILEQNPGADDDEVQKKIFELISDESTNKKMLKSFYQSVADDSGQDLNFVKQVILQLVKDGILIMKESIENHKIINDNDDINVWLHTIREVNVYEQAADDAGADDEKSHLEMVAEKIKQNLEDDDVDTGKIVSVIKKIPTYLIKDI